MAKKKSGSGRNAKGSSKASTGRISWKGWLLRAAILGALWGIVAGSIFVAYCMIDLPDIHQVTQTPRRPSITLKDKNGTVFAHYGDLYGDHVTLATLPAYVPEAVIAIEDRRFYKHFGIDVFGILRAMMRNAFAGHLVQGGSTLTQQLAKNLFLSPERTLKRKVQEAILAIELERAYTKEQILTAYLNRVYLGDGTFGIDAAARTYFGKPAREMNVREAATIAGLLRAPSRYAPSRNPIEAWDRAKVVLGAMEDEGYITEKEYKTAMEDVPPPAQKPGVGGDGRYFADWIADQIPPMLGDTPQDVVVTTTLDLNLERSAERHIDQLLALQENKDVSQAALVTLADDGAVRVMVGGRDYRQSQYNRATQAMRQPGSAFKPIVYLAAIEEGLSPDDLLEDAPLTVGHWSPENFEGRFRGPVTAREALAESINTVAVRLFLRVGADKVIETARALGIASPLTPTPSLALGSSDVTPLELTGAYATLASGGRAIVPYGIKEIRGRDGQVLYRHADVDAPYVVDHGAVATLVGMMEDVIQNGTGRRAKIGRPEAGKTGTSSDYRDAWFIGFTGDYTTAVWLGNDDNHKMRKVIGGSLPAQVWHDYMMEAEANLPARDLMAGSSMLGQAAQGISDALGNFINGILSGK